MTAPTLRQAVEGMTLGFDPRAAASGAAVLEFEASGERPRLCHLVVEGGACRFATGPAPRPTLRLRTDGATWSAIGAGELEAAAALADGRLAAEGDAGALFQLRSWFHRVEGEALLEPGRRPPGALRLPAMAWMGVAFAPWKALWLALALGQPRVGALLGLALSGAIVAYRRSAGALTFFEAASAVAFAGAAALHLERLPARPATAASLAALAAIWALGAALRPLGLSGEYARWKYRPALSATALFRRPNVLVSLVWAGGFLVNALLALAPPAAGRLLPALLHAATLAACVAVTARQEKGAAGRRVDDIDRRLARLRRLGWAVAAAAGALLVVMLAA